MGSRDDVYKAAMERVRQALLAQNEMPPPVSAAYERVELWVLSSELVRTQMQQVSFKIMTLREKRVLEMRDVGRLTKQPPFQTETEFRTNVLDDYSPETLVFIDEVADRLEQLLVRHVNPSRFQLDVAIQDIEDAISTWVEADLPTESARHKRHAHIFDAKATRSVDLIRASALLRTVLHTLRDSGPLATASGAKLRRAINGPVQQLRTVATPQRVTDAKLVRPHCNRLYELREQEAILQTKYDDLYHWMGYVDDAWAVEYNSNKELQAHLRKDPAARTSNVFGWPAASRVVTEYVYPYSSRLAAAEQPGNAPTL